MKKKAMALTVAAMMAAAMITGCGQTAATTAETAAEQLPRGARNVVTLLLDGSD